MLHCMDAFMPAANYVDVGTRPVVCVSLSHSLIPDDVDDFHCQLYRGSDLFRTSPDLSYIRGVLTVKLSANQVKS